MSNPATCLLPWSSASSTPSSCLEVAGALRRFSSQFISRAKRSSCCMTAENRSPNRAWIRKCRVRMLWTLMRGSSTSRTRYSRSVSRSWRIHERFSPATSVWNRSSIGISRSTCRTADGHDLVFHTVNVYGRILLSARKMALRYGYLLMTVREEVLATLSPTGSCQVRLARASHLGSRAGLSAAQEHSPTKAAQPHKWRLDTSEPTTGRPAK